MWFAIFIILPIITAGLLALAFLPDDTNNHQSNNSRPQISQIPQKPQISQIPPEQSTNYIPCHIYYSRRLMTNNEISWYNALHNYINDINVSNESKYYVVLPQICLSSIINKYNENSHRGELFRIIDFVIFDDNTNPVCAIEINDKSHLNQDRVERDIKVKNILYDAKIPLITFGSMESVDNIKYKLSQVI